MAEAKKADTGTSEGTGIEQKDRFMVLVIVISALLFAAVALTLWLSWGSGDSADSPRSGLYMVTNVTDTSDKPYTLGITFEDGKIEAENSFVGKDGRLHQVNWWGEKIPCPNGLRGTCFKIKLTRDDGVQITVVLGFQNDGVPKGSGFVQVNTRESPVGDRLSLTYQDMSL